MARNLQKVSLDLRVDPPLATGARETAQWSDFHAPQSCPVMMAEGYCNSVTLIVMSRTLPGDDNARLAARVD